MKFHRLDRFTLALALAAAASSSFAHIGYTGRNFGTLNAGDKLSIANQTVTSNYGWADASDEALVFNASLASTPRADAASFISGVGSDDLYLGDSHKGKPFRLHLDSSLSVAFTASARDASGLTPGLSVYKGLAAVAPLPAGQTSADHDFAAASAAWRSSFAQSQVGVGYSHLATQGSWAAKGDWCVGGDGDSAGVAAALSCFEYVDSAASTSANGAVSTTLTLGPGDYTIYVGGNSLADKSTADSVKRYALTLDVAVAAVPEPQSWLLMLAGTLALALRRRFSPAV